MKLLTLGLLLATLVLVIQAGKSKKCPGGLKKKCTKESGKKVCFCPEYQPEPKKESSLVVKGEPKILARKSLKGHVTVTISCKEFRLESIRFRPYEKRFPENAQSVTLEEEYSHAKCTPKVWVTLVKRARVKNFGLHGHVVWVKMGCRGKFRICFDKKVYHYKKWEKKKAKAVVAVFKAPWFCFINKSGGKTGQSILLMWYFDRGQKCCKSFYFGGRPGEGNENRFHSSIECKHVCHPRHPHPKPPKPPKGQEVCFKHAKRMNSMFHKLHIYNFKGKLITKMHLVKQYSHSPCKFKYSFSFYEHRARVTEGCRGSFKICYVPGFTTTCFSWKYRTRICRYSQRIMRFRILKVHSKAKCQKDSTVLMVDPYAIMVKRGCRATIEIETRRKK